MKIQSLSVVVPNGNCINSCAFCVARMGKEERLNKNQMDSMPFYDLYLRHYLKRLEFCRDNGVSTLMLTGNYEPQQITFRVLYQSGQDTEQDQWIAQHSARPALVDDIRDYIVSKGRPIGKLEYGQTKYSVQGLTTVLDDDCMSQEVKQEMKYLILRPDCKLYSRWEDPASLLF